MNNSSEVYCFGDTIAVASDNYKINMLWQQNVEFLNYTPDGTFGYHNVING
jgi:hypothetical protein